MVYSDETNIPPRYYHSLPVVFGHTTGWLAATSLSVAEVLQHTRALWRLRIAIVNALTSRVWHAVSRLIPRCTQRLPDA